MGACSPIPDGAWGKLREALEAGNAGGAIAYVRSFHDPDRRHALFKYAQKAIFANDWDGKNLDDYATIVRAGIDELVRRAAAADSRERYVRLLDCANVMSYNLASDLADCWPGDELPRRRRHFEIGRAAAIDCLIWRERLDKGAWPLSMAWWAKATHELSLREAHSAAQSYEQAHAYAMAAAEQTGLAHDPASEYGVLIALGGWGLALRLAGDSRGRGLYGEAAAAFRRLAEAQVEESEDAAFGLACLRKLDSRLSLAA